MIQFSLDRMIIIHIILDINLYLINHQQRRTLCCHIPELLNQTLKCIIEKLVIHLFSVFFIILKISIFKIVVKIVRLKFLYLTKLRMAVMIKYLLDNLQIYWI